VTISSRAALLAAGLALVACPQETTPPVTGSPSQTPTVGGSATCTPIAGPEPFWETLAPAGVSRLEVAAAIVGRELFVAGGYVETPERVTRAVEIYDLDRGSWRPGPDLPIAVHHAMGIAYHDAFVVLGGFTAGSFAGASDRAFALRQDRWEELPRLARGRAAGTAAVVGDRIIVVGGQDGDGLIEPSEIFDGTRWRDAAALPTPRDHLAAASHEGYLYAAGGRRLSIASTMPRLERYDPATDRWERLPDMPTARGGIGAAVVGDLVVVVGGEGSERAAGSDGVFPDAEAFDVSRSRWISLPDLPTPRHGIGVASDGSFVYVAAGGRRAGFSASTILEGLNPGVATDPCE